MRPPHRAAVVAALIVALSGEVVGSALAAFSGGAAGSLAVSTATLHPPGTPTLVMACIGANKSSVALSWAASASPFAAGYTVTRQVGATPPVTLGSTPGTSWTDTTIAKLTTYTYDVVATYLSWTSPSPTVSVTTTKKC